MPICLRPAVTAPERNLIPLLAIRAALKEALAVTSPVSMTLLYPSLLPIASNDDLT